MTALNAVELAEMVELQASAVAASAAPVARADAATAGPFAPLFTRGTEPYALAELDELGRPLAGVYVPDALLL